MIKMIGNDVWRSGEKIGWVEGDYVHDKEGNRLGYFQDHAIFDVDGHKIAYVGGGHLISQDADSEARVSLDDIDKVVKDCILPEIAKCAIYVLLGS